MNVLLAAHESEYLRNRMPAYEPGKDLSECSISSSGFQLRAERKGRLIAHYRRRPVRDKEFLLEPDLQNRLIWECF